MSEALWIAFLPVMFWAFGAVCATRAARHYGALAANRRRLLLAFFLLGAWTTFATGWPAHRGAWRRLLISGAIGLGAGDIAMMTAFRRIGARGTALALNCGAAPVAAAVEWMALGTRLSVAEMLWRAGILGGVALAVSPGARIPARDRRALWTGLVCAGGSAISLAISVVLSRAAYRAAAADGVALDGVTATAPRMVVGPDSSAGRAGAGGRLADAGGDPADRRVAGARSAEPPRTARRPPRLRLRDRPRRSLKPPAPGRTGASPAFLLHGRRRSCNKEDAYCKS